MSNHSTGAARNRITAGLVLLGFAASGVVVQPAPVAASTMVTTTYSYTGATDTFTVPPGVSSITVTLKGGQGGLGGGDSQGSPTPGGYQGVVTGVVAVNAGDAITVAVGGGGGTGTSSRGSAPGGSAGLNPLSAYNGARGGTAGPQGSSGGGGGSGAASVLKIGTTEIVAGGAGGNGGNGQFLPIVGRRAEESHTPRSDITSSTGRPGVNTSTMCSPGFSCDGGASGAGGGGAVGGEHGAVQYGGATATEYFGFGGYPGANSTAGLTGLGASYDYYAANNANGTITISYDDGAPGAPLNLAGTGGTGAVALTWNAPAASGNSAITDYLVEVATISGGPFTIVDDGVSTTTGTEVTGLTNGVTYFFRVAAINLEGTGSAATTMIAVVPSDVPAPPAITGLVPFGAGIHVDFTPGASDAPITAYEYRLGAGDWTIGSVTSGRLTISGLTNGQAYSVQIRSLNIIGASDGSTPPQSATPRDVAQAPTAVLAVAADGAIGLTWNAPTVDNGALVTDYLVQTATTVGGTYETFVDDISTSTTATITGLVNGTTYYLRVAAVNAVGVGAWSTSEVATPYTSPGAPSVALTPGDGALTVAITPGFDGGSAIASYEYRLGASGSWKSTGAATTGFAIAGLANATSYDVFVRAINAAGPSPASTVVSAVPRTVPAAPAIATVALDTGAVSVSFIVGSDGGSALTNVEYSINGGTTWVTRSPESTLSPVTIGGLVGGETYPVRLRVVNDAGVSAPSNTSSVTAKGTPDAPAINITAADRSLVATFAAPANGGTPITNYRYSLDGGASWIPRSPSATSSPLVIGGLGNGESYSVRLQAVNAVGIGAASNIVVGVPMTVPGAPTLGSTTIAGVDGNIDVFFTAPASGGSVIVGYQYSTDAGATWRDHETGSTDSPLRITTTSSDPATALAGGVPYPVEIRALNVVGAGTASAVATGITTYVPGAPVNVTVDTRDAAASIRFTPPTNGGSAIIRYEYRLTETTVGSEGTAGLWIDTESLADEFVISELDNSATYSLEFRAVNDVGSGLFAVQSFQVFTTPASPALDATVAGDQTLAVGFTADNDGGSPITGYEYSTDGGATWRSRTSGTTGTPLLITTESGTGAALTNAVIYAVQLRAVNAAGSGAASETVLAAPRGTPSAPTAMNVAAGDGALVVTFTSGDDGGSPITAIEYRLNDTGEWINPGSLASPLTVGGLNNGELYSIAVRALNAVGPGAPSVSLSGTPRTVPDAPTGVMASSGAGQITVSWVAPPADGGAPITGYTVSLYPQATGGTAIGTCTTQELLTCTASGLANGTTVYADVTAGNDAGAGAPSAPRIALTPLAVPQVAIESITTSANDLSIAVDIVDDGGAPITAFEYQLGSGTWLPAPSATSPFTISGLTTGVEYSVRIRAITAAGSGNASQAVTAVPHTTPSPPTAVSATGAGASAALSWTAPASSGGQPVTDYILQYSANSGASFTTFADGTSSATTATVTGLTNATAYVFRVAAANTAGPGSWSALASATPLDAPGAPTNVTVTPGSSFLRVTFTAPTSNGGSVITGYQFRLDGGIWRAASATSSPLMITGLTNGQLYDVQIRAMNAVGGGAESAVVPDAKPYGLPGAVIGLRATPSSDSVTLTWDAVNDNGSAITAYNLIRWSKASEGFIVGSFPTTATTRTFTGLTNDTYYYTVEATNAAGTGSRSAPRTTAVVGGTVPEAPSAISTSAEGVDMEMDWTSGDAGTSPITGHLVQYSTDDITWATVTSGPGETTASFDLPSTSTPYALRAAAVSKVGAGPFTTVRPPIAATGSVSDVSTRSATVGGTVNANDGGVDVTFEVATTAEEFGTSASTTVAATPAYVEGSADTPVSATLTDLEPATSYVVRSVVTTDGAVSRGAIRSFTTDTEAVSTPITVEGLIDTALDSGPLVLPAVTPGNLPLTYTADPVSVCTVAGTTVNLHGVGTCTVTANQAGDAGHLPATATGSFAVTAIPQIVTIPGLDDISIDASPLLLTATMPSGLPLDYTAGPPDVCAVDGTVLTLLAEGRCTVTASQSGNETYFPARATASFVVGPTMRESSLQLSLQLEAGQAIADAAIVVAGDGLKPHSAVRIELHSTPVLLGTATTDADGSFRTTVRMPEEVPAGTHHIVAIGTAPDDRTVTATEEIFVDWSGSLGEMQTGGGYTPLTAIRILDTRESGGRMTAGNEYRLVVPPSLVPADVTALVLNLAVTESTQSGYITIYPCGVTRPLAAAINFTAGETKANLVDAMFRSGGALCLWSNVDTHAVVDLQGFQSTSGGGRLVPRTAVRLVDTRPADALAAGQVMQIPVIGDGKARAGTTTVALNVAVDDPERAGFLTVYPCGTNRPWAANLNFAAGQTVSNEVMVQPGADGMVCVYTTATTQLVVDLNATYDAAATTSFSALVPGRLADTRSTTKVLGGEAVELHIVGADGAPTGTTALSFNIAVTEPEAAGFLTVYPCDATMPLAANLNFAAGQTTSNHVTAAVSADGTICVFASRTTHVVVDVEGTYR